MYEHIEEVLIIGFTEGWNGTKNIRKAQEEIEAIIHKYNLTHKYDNFYLEVNIPELEGDVSEDIEKFYERLDMEFFKKVNLKEDKNE